jgi:hypothetical protein
MKLLNYLKPIRAQTEVLRPPTEYLSHDIIPFNWVTVNQTFDTATVYNMDELTIKTPNPKCRLFCKIDLLTDFAALCLTDFTDWRYIHSWLVFSTQLVNCCPHGQRNYTCVLLPLYLLFDSPPPHPPFLNCM